ncbi:MAG: hypothetical protein P8P24_07045 [Planktomarina sp.]|nr:hypothetical protein [Planktomarina sp.]
MPHSKMHAWMPHAVKLYLADKEHGHTSRFGVVLLSSPVNGVALCLQD